MFKTWHWEITTKCNMSCSHCLHGTKKRSDPKWSLRQYLEIIDSIRSLGGKDILFTSGEPFYLKDFLAIANYAKTVGFRVSVITNGTLFNEHSLLTTSQIFDTVGISIDGQNADHDLIRGAGSYQKTIQSITNLLKLNVQVIAYITVNGINIHSQKQILNELIELGVRSFHFNQLNIQGNAIANRQLHFNCSQDEIKRQLFQQINELVNINIDRKWDDGCSVELNTVYMSCQGQIYSCVEIATHNPADSIASINDMDIGLKWRRYHSAFTRPPGCKYGVFNNNGIVIQLNCDECLFVESER
ncbi:MAG: radical SAM protein [Candidatus Saccharibacteria bacterium]